MKFLRRNQEPAKPSQARMQVEEQANESERVLRRIESALENLSEATGDVQELRRLELVAARRRR